MSRPASCIRHKTKVKAIYNLLKSRSFGGFPVVNARKQCIGLIGRHSLQVILKNIERVPSLEEQENELKKNGNIAFGLNESNVSVDNDIEEEDDGDSAEVVDLGGRSSLEGLTQRRKTTVEIEEEKDEMEGGEDSLYDGGDPLIRQPLEELTWSDFNVDFHSSVDDINDDVFTTVNLKYGPK